jgi:hypothetical protein
MLTDGSVCEEETGGDKRARRGGADHSRLGASQLGTEPQPEGKPIDERAALVVHRQASGADLDSELDVILRLSNRHALELLNSE